MVLNAAWATIARSKIWPLTASGKSGLWCQKEDTLRSRQASSIGERKGAQEGAGRVRNVTAAQVSGRVGCVVWAAAAVEVEEGVGVYACGGRGTGLDGETLIPCSLVLGGGRGGGAGR